MTRKKAKKRHEGYMTKCPDCNALLRYEIDGKEVILADEHGANNLCEDCFKRRAVAFPYFEIYLPCHQDDIAEFDTYEEALAFVKTEYGADENGRICLIKKVNF